MPNQAPRALVVVTAFFDDLVAEGVKAAVFEVTAPRSVEWTRNSARKADQATIEIAYRDFPVDPRLFSAIHVAVYTSDARRGSIASPSNLRFIGYADRPEATLNGSDAFIQLECRDYTSLALDRSWRRVADEVQVQVRTGEKSQTKKSHIRIHPGMTLAAFVTEWRRRLEPPEQVLSRPETVFADPSFATIDISRAASGSILAMKNGDTAWDALLLVCEWFGLLPVWEIDEQLGVVLRIRGAASTQGAERRLNWGQNVTELRIARDLQGPERKQVRVVAYNPRLAKAFAADFPRSPVLKTGMNIEGAPTGANQETNLRRVQYHLYGDYTQAQISQVAERVYQDQYRRRIEGQVRTRDWLDSDGGSVMSLGNGDTLTLQIDPKTLHGLDHLSTGAAARYLADPNRPNSLPPDAAMFVAENMQRMRNLGTDFYVTEVRHTWDVNDGYSAEIMFSDFIAD